MVQKCVKNGAERIVRPLGDRCSPDVVGIFSRRLEEYEFPCLMRLFIKQGEVDILGPLPRKNRTALGLFSMRDHGSVIGH